MQFRTFLLRSVFTGLAVVTVGCSALLGAEDTEEVSELALSVRMTATALAAPTATPTPFPTLPPTAEPVADTAQSESSVVEAPDVLPEYISSELARLGLGEDSGELGWEHPPLLVEAEGYLQYKFQNYELLTLVEDFVISADITWDTDTGLAGCGFVIRADKETDPNAYTIGLSRSSNGSVNWATLENGVPIKNNAQSVAGLQSKDPSFDWQNNTTNRITIVARGESFDVYTNGVYIETMTGQSPFAVEKGFTGFLAINESGKTSCHFQNGWLWHLNK